ncbi:hypothetical protein A1Q1_07950 [Trichosporon asahii var. asahii CBS 2479]|uniref:Uncharacterized protein n=1 Tax=Trichosporon asahii var. asahii (strain ATCC 90039 / CBS 2479 / JCM 2466 / KCTC 7840 / NBRC 103889/ NCYC 2677 / UAMH 7654) TaxID=1186058 RepID=J5R620_TRIAS|nr:hypothetical protein A1Q1_07950 [Trichosporon asahii var. asahii CBS 2479]EJT50888.1 hypothetical protein A1Q1_07950 [Trichosporon asahii var. asahii CBS 2479]
MQAKPANRETYDFGADPHLATPLDLSLPLDTCSRYVPGIQPVPPSQPVRSAPQIIQQEEWMISARCGESNRDGGRRGHVPGVANWN